MPCREQISTSVDETKKGQETHDDVLRVGRCDAAVVAV